MHGCWFGADAVVIRYLSILISAETYTSALRIDQKAQFGHVFKASAKHL